VRQHGYRSRSVAAVALLLLALVWTFFSTAAPAGAEAPDEPGRATAPGQVKKAGDEPEAPVCPEGEYPNNDGGCSPPTCPDGSAVPESGECAPGCPDGSEICETRSCPVDLPLPPGALCEDGGGALSSVPDPEPAPNPIVTTVTATEGGGGTGLGPAAQASVFGRPAEVLGVTLDLPTVQSTLPAVAATGAETAWLALAGFLLIGVGSALVRGATPKFPREAWRATTKRGITTTVSS
jgi:hypothetical protein